MNYCSSNSIAQYNLSNLVSSYMSSLKSASTPEEARSIATTIEGILGQYDNKAHNNKPVTPGLKAKGQCESCTNCGNCGKSKTQGQKLAVLG